MKNSSTTLHTLQEKKNRGYLLAASFERLGYPDRARLVQECGTYIGILDTGEGAKIVEANFCKQRLCPSCNWRRSLKIYGATSQILDHLDQQYGKSIKYLFLTLTVKNVPMSDLGKAIDGMAEAFKRLTNNRAWKNRVKGAMRTLEVTINHETQEAHPHYHLILAVDRSYATKNDDTYWTHADWQAAWQKSARLTTPPTSALRGSKAVNPVLLKSRSIWPRTPTTWWMPCRPTWARRRPRPSPTGWWATS